jgi:hypothetical protein
MLASLAISWPLCTNTQRPRHSSRCLLIQVQSLAWSGIGFAAFLTGLAVSVFITITISKTGSQNQRGSRDGNRGPLTNDAFHSVVITSRFSASENTGPSSICKFSFLSSYSISLRLSLTSESETPSFLAISSCDGSSGS